MPKFIDLDAFNIESKRIDSTMGSMANFYKNNLDMLRDDLKYQTKKFVKEFIFEYKNLRNGYFHKHNICEWATIEKIRDATFSLMFLMLGTYKFQEGDMAALGNDSMVQEDDFYKLCEYMNYHSGDLFFIKNDKHQDEIFWAHGDPYMETKDGHFAYSGVYIKELRPNGKVFKMVRERVADEIHLGTLGIQPNEEVKINPQKVKPIFIHGKFVGPLIEDECIMEY